MKLQIITKIAPFVVLLAIASGCSKMPGSADASAPDPSAQPNALASNSDNSNGRLPFSSKAGESKAGEAAQESLTIPSGTSVTVRLQNAVSSATSNAGDKFDAVLDAPLMVGDKTVAPAGAAVTGRVVTAHRSGRLQDPGVISLALSSITIDGRSHSVSSSSVVAKGASHKKRNWAMIGGGAGGGALVGGLLGGPKGMLIGSAVGAGAGTTTAYATGKKDVGFGAERRLTFRLTQPLSLR